MRRFAALLMSGRPVVSGPSLGPVAVVAGGAARLGHGRDELVDARGLGGDLGAEDTDLVQHPYIGIMSAGGGV